MTTTEFEERTGLVTGMLVLLALEEQGQGNHPLASEFAEHCEKRVLYLYTHNRKWKRKLLSEEGREWAEEFIRHWTAAFLLNPADFFTKQPVELLN